jgi:hypothetical protein
MEGDRQRPSQHLNVCMIPTPPWVLTSFFATLSQHRLMHAACSYRAWKATACLKVLQRGRIKLPLRFVLGNLPS